MISMQRMSRLPHLTPALALAQAAGLTAAAPVDLSGENKEPSVLLVRLQDGADQASTSRAHLAAGVSRVVWTSTLVPGLIAVEAPSGKSADALASYRKEPTVRYAEGNGRVRLFSQTTPYGIDLVRAPQVWPNTQGQGTRIAVIDTGVDLTHPDLPRPIRSISLVAGEDVQDRLGHGTHCSGTALALNNDLGVVGVAPQAELLVAKIFDASGYATDLQVAQAIEWSVQNGAKVISMSLGGGFSQAEADVVAAAARQGVTLVAAAGNYSTDDPSYPAAFPEVISVSAIDALTQRASFSNFGPTIDIAAPGVDVLSTLPGGTYGYLNGTSMATPHVAGLAGLLWSSANTPNVSASLIREAIERGASDLGTSGIDDPFGWGLANAERAKSYLDRMSRVTCPADLDDGSGRGTPDGGVSTDDLLYMLTQYAAGSSTADLDDGSATGTPDGGVTIDDLLFFLGLYQDGGCESILHAPSELLASHDASTANLDVVITWRDNANHETSHQVFRSTDGSTWRLVGEVPAGQTRLVDTRDLAEGVHYMYKARALRESPDRILVSNFSNLDEAIPSQWPIAAPSGCNAQRDDATPELDVVITWQNNHDNASGVRIARSTDRINWTNVGEVGPTSTSFRDSRNLEPDQRYWYKVRAFIQTPTGRAYSPYSNEESAIPRTPTVNAPSNCAATRDDSTPCMDILVSWTDNSNNETGFNISRSEDGVSWDQVGEVGAGRTTFRDSGTPQRPLVDGRRYFYRVRAKMEISGQPTVYSDYSNTESAIVRAPVITAPTNLVAARDDSTPQLDVLVTWTDNSNNETGFNIARAINPDNPNGWTQIGAVGAGVTLFRDVGAVGGIVSGQRYYYRVRAKIEGCNEGTHFSNYSDVDDAIPR